MKFGKKETGVLKVHSNRKCLGIQMYRCVCMCVCVHTYVCHWNKENVQSGGVGHFENVTNRNEMYSVLTVVWLICEVNSIWRRKKNWLKFLCLLRCDTMIWLKIEIFRIQCFRMFESNDMNNFRCKHTIICEIYPAGSQNHVSVDCNIAEIFAIIPKKICKRHHLNQCCNWFRCKKSNGLI